jgi:hypothetical protein
MCTVESVAANRPSYFNRTSFAQGHPPFPRAISSPLPPPPPLPVARNFTPEHPNEGALLSRFLQQINLESQRVTPFSQVASYRHFFSRANDAQLVAQSRTLRVNQRRKSVTEFHRFSRAEGPGPNQLRKSSQTPRNLRSPETRASYGWRANLHAKVVHRSRARRWTVNVHHDARSVAGLHVLRHAAVACRQRRAGTSPVDPAKLATAVTRYAPGVAMAAR